MIPIGSLREMVVQAVEQPSLLLARYQLRLYLSDGLMQLRPGDDMYNAKVGQASLPEKPKEVSPTKNFFLSLSFLSDSSQDQLR